MPIEAIFIITFIIVWCAAAFLLISLDSIETKQNADRQFKGAPHSVKSILSSYETEPQPTVKIERINVTSEMEQEWAETLAVRGEGAYTALDVYHALDSHRSAEDVS